MLKTENNTSKQTRGNTQRKAPTQQSQQVPIKPRAAPRTQTHRSPAKETAKTPQQLKQQPGSKVSRGTAELSEVLTKYTTSMRAGQYKMINGLKLIEKVYFALHQVDPKKPGEEYVETMEAILSKFTQVFNNFVEDLFFSRHFKMVRAVKAICSSRLQESFETVVAKQLKVMIAMDPNQLASEGGLGRTPMRPAKKEAVTPVKGRAGGAQSSSRTPVVNRLVIKDEREAPTRKPEVKPKPKVEPEPAPKVEEEKKTVATPATEKQKIPEKTPKVEENKSFEVDQKKEMMESKTSQKTEEPRPLDSNPKPSPRPKQDQSARQSKHSKQAAPPNTGREKRVSDFKETQPQQQQQQNPPLAATRSVLRNKEQPPLPTNPKNEQKKKQEQSGRINTQRKRSSHKRSTDIGRKFHKYNSQVIAEDKKEKEMHEKGEKMVDKNKNKALIEEQRMKEAEKAAKQIREAIFAVRRETSNKKSLNSGQKKAAAEMPTISIPKQRSEKELTESYYSNLDKEMEQQKTLSPISYLKNREAKEDKKNVEVHEYKPTTEAVTTTTDKRSKVKDLIRRRTGQNAPPLDSNQSSAKRAITSFNPQSSQKKSPPKYEERSFVKKSPYRPTVDRSDNNGYKLSSRHQSPTGVTTQVSTGRGAPQATEKPVNRLLFTDQAQKKTVIKNSSKKELFERKDAAAINRAGQTRHSLNHQYFKKTKEKAQDEQSNMGAKTSYEPSAPPTPSKTPTYNHQNKRSSIKNMKEKLSALVKKNAKTPIKTGHNPPFSPAPQDYRSKSLEQSTVDDPKDPNGLCKKNIADILALPGHLQNLQNEVNNRCETNQQSKDQLSELNTEKPSIDRRDSRQESRGERADKRSNAGYSGSRNSQVRFREDTSRVSPSGHSRYRDPKYSPGAGGRRFSRGASPIENNNLMHSPHLTSGTQRQSEMASESAFGHNNPNETTSSINQTNNGPNNTSGFKDGDYLKNNLVQDWASVLNEKDYGNLNLKEDTSLLPQFAQIEDNDYDYMNFEQSLNEFGKKKKKVLAENEKKAQKHEKEQNDGKKSHNMTPPPIRDFYGEQGRTSDGKYEEEDKYVYNERRDNKSCRESRKEIRGPGYEFYEDSRSKTTRPGYDGERFGRDKDRSPTGANCYNRNYRSPGRYNGGIEERERRPGGHGGGYMSRNGSPAHNPPNDYSRNEERSGIVHSFANEEFKVAANNGGGAGYLGAPNRSNESKKQKKVEASQFSFLEKNKPLGDSEVAGGGRLNRVGSKEVKMINITAKDIPTTDKKTQNPKVKEYKNWGGEGLRSPQTKENDVRVLEGYTRTIDYSAGGANKRVLGNKNGNKSTGLHNNQGGNLRHRHSGGTPNISRYDDVSTKRSQNSRINNNRTNVTNLGSKNPYTKSGVEGLSNRLRDFENKYNHGGLSGKTGSYANGSTALHSRNHMQGRHIRTRNLDDKTLHHRPYGKRLGPSTPNMALNRNKTYHVNDYARRGFK